MCLAKKATKINRIFQIRKPKEKNMCDEQGWYVKEKEREKVKSREKERKPIFRLFIRIRLDRVSPHRP